MTADEMKVRVAECLISINDDVNPVNREKWGPIVPPTAIDWIADAIVSALTEPDEEDERSPLDLKGHPE